MMMRCLALFLLLALGAVTVDSIRPRPVFKGVLNEAIGNQLSSVKLHKAIHFDNLKTTDPDTFIDQVLLMVDEVIQAEHLDPYEIIDTDFLGGHLTAYIGGYSSMSRLGDASIINADGTISITATIVMNSLAGNFSWHVDVLGISFDGGATAVVASVDIKLALRFVQDPTTLAISGYVDDLQVYDIGTITVDVFGLGPFDYLVNAIADVIANVLKYFIPILIDGLLKDIFQQVIDTIIAAL